MTRGDEDSLKVAALILARGGSKGVPMKNVRNLCGYPLIAWSVNACKKARGIDDVWVSTDSDLIANAAAEAGARVHRRAAYTATDDAPSVLGIREFVQAHPEYDIMGLVQATSPMVLPEFLEEAVEKMKCGDWDSVFAVKRMHAFLWTDTEDSKSFTTHPINVDPGNRPRRQDWPGVLAENGMFYFFRASTCLIYPFQHGRMAVVEVPMKFSLDIDTELDFQLVETSIVHLAEELVLRGSLAPVGQACKR